MPKRQTADPQLHEGTAPAWRFRRRVPMSGATAELFVRVGGPDELLHRLSDPAVYCFAHGGKDGHPYSVNRPLYDANLERLRQAVQAARIGHTDKVEALKALAAFTSRLEAR